MRDKAVGKIISKLENRLDTWKSSLLSSGGRLILVNSCLSNIPTYSMGFYRLNEKVHSMLDTIRFRFFWRGVIDKLKYHMVNWGDVCRPKDYGGLGVLNTRLFNDCLLCKWLWKIGHN